LKIVLGETTSFGQGNIESTKPTYEMSIQGQGSKEGLVRRAFGRRAFPNLFGLLQIIPKPRWAAPTLVFLGILSSFAEAVGIALVPLFFYSMMNQLNLVALNGGPLGVALRYAMRQFHSSRGIALVLLLLIVIRGVLAYAYAIATSHISEQMSRITRDRVHNQYLRLPYRFIQQHEQAELAQILGHDAWLLSAAYTSFTRIFINATFIVILGCFLAVFSWKILLCTLCGSLLLSALLRLLSSRARAIGTEVKRVHRDMWDHMMVTLQGMRTIRAFGQEDTHQGRFDLSSAAARDVDLKGMQLTLILDPLTEVGYLVILGTIIVGAQYLGVSFAAALTCVALLYRLQPHVRELEGVRLKLLQLEPQLLSVRSILEAEVKDGGESGGIAIQSIQRRIRFQEVTFSYTEGGPRALDQVTFQIPAGVTTALVGASGSGKSTIVNLLLRLYVPDSGVTYVDDTPLEELSRADWLKLIAVAGQDVDLIDGTVLENIKMADIHASDEAIATALQIVGISELIESLPDGYNTWVGHQGMRFSGGQRQRIGLARAALHNPKFLILDEAMNAMDLALEQRVRRAIDTHFEGCTILLITHRLETVLNSAHLVWIDDGRIVAEGTPGEMLLDNESALSKALATIH
jgi:ABC-type multidrug transport system fused ATPase/permease subunit